MWFMALGIATALAGTPPDLDASPATPESQPPQAPVDTPIWSGGTRDQIFDIVGVEGHVKALGSAIQDVHLLSADLDWGDYVSTPTGKKDNRDAGFSHSSLTVTRQRVLDATLLDTVQSLEHPGTYDLSDPNERARLCARMPADGPTDLDLHTWTQHAQQLGENDLNRRGESPSILMADGNATRTALIALEPGESVTLVELSDPSSRRAHRRLQVQRQKRTLTVTEGTAISKVCLDY